MSPRTAAGRPALLVLPPILALALVGCTAPDPEDDAAAVPTVTVTATPPSPASSPVPSASASAGGSDVALADVIAAAQRAASGATVVSVDEDDEAGSPWDVTVVTDGGAERDLRVSGRGEVVAGPTDDGTDADDRADNRRLLAGSATSAAEAAAAAQSAAGGRLTELALDERDDGRVVWEADVAGSPDGTARVVVDARSGDVLAD